MSDFIFEEFEPSSAAAWKQKIQFELDGADYNTLLTKTNEGITIKPFYHIDDFEKVEVPDIEGSFIICRKIIIDAEENANNKAIEAIKNGINSIKFIAKTTFNIEELFKNILQKNIEFHFQFNFLSEEFANQLIDFLKKETSYLNIDIIGKLAKTGNWFTSINEDFKIVENLVQKNNLSSIIGVDVNIYQNAGANTVQQVAYALCHANEYLTKFGGHIAKNIQFNFAAGSNHFFEIAKIRTFRYLLQLVLNEYNENCAIPIFSEPSVRNKTSYNSKLNNLRAYSENMSAILGGANTIAVKHENISNYTSVEAEPHKVTNESYYIESITKQIAEKALIIFKDIEKSGGLLSQLKEGTIQRKIKENAQKEQSQFNKNELVLVGANKYIQKNEAKSYSELITPPSNKPRKTLIIPISPARLAEKLEQKRKKHEA